MEKTNKNSTFTGATAFNFAVEITSCSGGTISNICSSTAEANRENINRTPVRKLNLMLVPEC